MDLTGRRADILRAVVELYVKDGLPVSSQRVAEHLGDRPEVTRGRGSRRSMSAATVRHELVALTAAGMLLQAHHSAGRTPTQLGLRTYLDHMLSPRMHPWDRTHLDEAARSGHPSALPGSLGQTLAELSGELTVVGVPRVLGTVYREIGLAKVGPTQLIVYFVSAGGEVQQKLIDVDRSLSADELPRVQNYLNRCLTHRTLQEIRDVIAAELNRERTVKDTLQRTALEIGLKALPEPEVELVIEGRSQLAQKPEFADISRLQALLRTIETKSVLLQLLEQIIDGPEVTVMLGSEHDVSEAQDLACIGIACRGPTGPAVTIGVVGPTRMDYERLIPMVRYAKDLFERHWKPF